MRLLKSQIEQKTGAGFAALLPEEPEDMVGTWSLTILLVARLQSDPRKRPHTCEGSPKSLKGF
jgi:hypothetical protein